MKSKLTTTLDPKIIKELQKESKSELRSVSDMLNIILCDRYNVTPNPPAARGPKKEVKSKPKLIRRGKAA